MLSRLALAGIVAALLADTAFAQRQPPSPEQRIDRLEKQVQQMQRQVFPRGRPADTAGFVDDPAAPQSAVISLAQKLDSLERQMAELVRQSEDNGNALRSLQAELAQARRDSEDRIAGLEQRLATGVAAEPGPSTEPVSATPAKARSATVKPAPAETDDVAQIPASDPGEEAYTIGFKQWEGGDYDAAIRSLRAFVAKYPSHRRVSFANNLIGRSLLDKGQPRAASEVLLANYRKNPKGERAADSLYYLGQSLMKLNQPGQACKAYDELETIYGSKIRADLKKLVASAKSDAKC